MVNQIQAEITIEGGKISRIKPANNEVIIISENTRTVYPGHYALPGFIDSHAHVAAFGKELNGLSLAGCKSAEECLEAAKNHNQLLKGWLIGRGWDQEKWSDKNFPDKTSLDDAFPSTPVYFIRIDGHAAWCNSKALQLAGISGNASSPLGGEILLDKHGNPTGILIDNAMKLITDILPKYEPDDTKKFIIDALNVCAASGLTEVYDLDLNPDLVEILIDLEKEKRLPIKIHSYLRGQNDEWLAKGLSPYRGEYFSIDGVKFYADGALGSWGAALLKPYTDKPESTGLMLINKIDLYSKAEKALNMGFGIATHAIGDAACRMVIDEYSKLRKAGFRSDEHQLRLEHMQMVHEDDLKKMCENDIIASVQPIHCCSDASGLVAKRLGDKRNSILYPWKSVLDFGGKLIAGSDFPIESHNPLTGINSFINRIPFNQSLPFEFQEAISLSQTFDAYCETPRQNSLTDKSSAEISLGVSADFVVLKSNIFNFNNSIIPTDLVAATYCNGKNVSCVRQIDIFRK
ncbi:MAG: Amidohydro 3 protein [Ignavibacteria bacterium]|nr:Amidohydro 3 protein [Ignavibacteria bacterium]